jgi:transposase-like protein
MDNVKTEQEVVILREVQDIISLLASSGHHRLYHKLYGLTKDIRKLKKFFGIHRKKFPPYIQHRIENILNG